MLARTGQGRGAQGRKGPRGCSVICDGWPNLDLRIDRTEPIYEQTLALEKAHKDMDGME